MTFACGCIRSLVSFTLRHCELSANHSLLSPVFSTKCIDVALETLRQLATEQSTINQAHMLASVSDLVFVYALSMSGIFFFQSDRLGDADPTVVVINITVEPSNSISRLIYDVISQRGGSTVRRSMCRPRAETANIQINTHTARSEHNPGTFVTY